MSMRLSWSSATTWRSSIDPGFGFAQLAGRVAREIAVDLDGLQLCLRNLAADLRRACNELRILPRFASPRAPGRSAS